MSILEEEWFPNSNSQWQPHSQGGRRMGVTGTLANHLAARLLAGEKRLVRTMGAIAIFKHQSTSVEQPEEAKQSRIADREGARRHVVIEGF